VHGCASAGSGQVSDHLRVPGDVELHGSRGFRRPLLLAVLGLVDGRSDRRVDLVVEVVGVQLVEEPRHPCLHLGQVNLREEASNAQSRDGDLVSALQVPVMGDQDDIVRVDLEAFGEGVLSTGVELVPPDSADDDEDLVDAVTQTVALIVEGLFDVVHVV